MDEELNKGSEKSFGLPEGYFDRSAESLMQRIEWIEEHRAFPRLTELKDSSVFTVPGNFFSKKALSLELMCYPELSSISRSMPFDTPADYFETSRIDLFLAGQSSAPIRKNRDLDIFDLPEGYFEKSSAGIQSKLKGTKGGGRIISMRRRIRYSMAATLLIALSIWIYNSYFVKPWAEDCGTMACVDRQDVLTSKNIENLEIEELYELVNTSELEEKLNAKDDLKTPGNHDSTENTAVEELYDDI